MPNEDAESFFYGLHRGQLLTGMAFAALFIAGSFITGYTSGIFLFGIFFVLIAILFVANEYLYDDES